MPGEKKVRPCEICGNYYRANKMYRLAMETGDYELSGRPGEVINLDPPKRT